MSDGRKHFESAQKRWAKAAELSVYDDPRIIRNILPDVRDALEDDPNRIEALVLLSELLMELGSYDEAEKVVATLVKLEPGEAEHRRKQMLLESRDRNAIRDYIEGERLPNW